MENDLDRDNRVASKEFQRYGVIYVERMLKEHKEVIITSNKIDRLIVTSLDRYEELLTYELHFNLLKSDKKKGDGRPMLDFLKDLKKGM